MGVNQMRADARASIQRILEAARRVFASGDGTGTLNNIAKESGVGIATLYRHFANRRTLARAVYERIFNTEIEPLLTQLEQSDLAREALLEMAERLAEIARRERGLILSLGSLGQVTVDLLAPHQPAFEDLIARGKAAGTLREDLTGTDVPHLIVMFTSCAAALEVDSEARRRYLGMLLDGLAVGPTA